MMGLPGGCEGLEGLFAPPPQPRPSTASSPAPQKKREVHFRRESRLCAARAVSRVPPPPPRAPPIDRAAAGTILSANAPILSSNAPPPTPRPRRYSLFAHAPAAAGAFRSEAGAEALERLVDWTCDVIYAHGGCMTSASLGSSLSETDPAASASRAAQPEGGCRDERDERAAATPPRTSPGRATRGTRGPPRRRCEC
mmetsp:Transcript_8017/g.25098  ORF Transcript_8017/g.25098 Transcript_8017/m.25098 type:complete len:197 (+) Transcript_8017:288-878(+)